MIPGSGPGRGVPWWRQAVLLRLRPDFGVPEPVGLPREGRTVAVVRR